MNVVDIALELLLYAAVQLLPLACVCVCVCVCVEVKKDSIVGGF